MEMQTKTQNEIDNEIIAQIVDSVLKAGYRAFVAERGHYGFFTDQAGSRVVSFATDLGGSNVSGNYITDAPQSCGTGWRIADWFIPGFVAHYFNSAAQQWAVRGARWRYKPLDVYLKEYQQSSKFTEIKDRP